MNKVIESSSVIDRISLLIKPFVITSIGAGAIAIAAALFFLRTTSTPIAPITAPLNTNPTTVFTIPSAARPAYRVATPDPTFGTTITRITGLSTVASEKNIVYRGAAPSADTWRAYARHHYSKDQPWSSDQKWLAIEQDYDPSRASNPKDLYLDGTTYEPIKTCPGHEEGEGRWHPSKLHPNERIAVNDRGDTLEWFDISTCTQTRKWTLPMNVEYMGPSEGNPSFDGRFVALTDKHKMFVVDMDPQLPEAPYPNKRFTLTPVQIDNCGLSEFGVDANGNPNPCDVDWVSVSPDGNYVVVSYQGDYLRIYDVNPANLQLTPRPMPASAKRCNGHSASQGFLFDLGHADMTRNPFDTDNPLDSQVIIGQTRGFCEDEHPVDDAGKTMGGVTMVRLRDGRVTTLTNPNKEAYPHHISTRNYDRPGWVYVGYFKSTGNKFSDEIIALKMDGSYAVERLVHKHGAHSGCYNCEGHSVPSPDGQRVLWASNWLVDCTSGCGPSGEIKAYVVDSGPLRTTTACTEQWVCSAWSACSASGAQSRTCTDSNACGTTATKPALTQSCTPPPVNQAPDGVINTPAATITVTTGQSVNFTSTATDPDNNTPLKYAWSFGGGAPASTVEDPGDVAFPTAGAYTVSFTVQDALGLSDGTPATRTVTVNAPPRDTVAPVISGGQPTGELSSGTTQASLSISTNENATCRYATTANTDYSAMTNTFVTTGATNHTTMVTGLQAGRSYGYFIRCQDVAVNKNATDYPINFSVKALGTSGVTGLFHDDFENGKADDTTGDTNGWSTLGTGSWAIATDGTAVYKQSNNTGDAWATNGATDWTNYSVEARMKPLAYNTSGFTGLYARWRDANNWYYLRMTADRLEIKKNVNGTITLLKGMNYTFKTGTWYKVKIEVTGPKINAYVNDYKRLDALDTSIGAGKFGIGTYQAASQFDDIDVQPVEYIPDTTPPIRLNGQPGGTLPAGTRQATMSLTTAEYANCKYGTTPGIAFDSMTNTFTTLGAGSFIHVTGISGLADGKSYKYYVRCQDVNLPPNKNTDDYAISFAIQAAAATPTNLLKDDFQDGNADGWNTIGTGTWTVVPEGEARYYRQANTTGDAWSNTGSLDWTNYTLQANLRPLSFGPSGFVGLYGRWKDSTHWYYLRITPTVIELKRNNGNSYTVLGTSTTALPTTSWSTVGLTMSGPNLSVTLNGSVLFTATDSTFASGMVGVGTYNASAAFDEVTVIPK